MSIKYLIPLTVSAANNKMKNIYYYQRKIPKRISSFLRHKIERFSLKTASFKVAQAIVIEINALFDAAVVDWDSAIDKKWSFDPQVVLGGQLKQRDNDANDGDEIDHEFFDIPSSLEGIINLYLKTHRTSWKTDKTYRQTRSILERLYKLTPKKTVLKKITPHHATMWTYQIREEWVSEKRQLVTLIGYVKKWKYFWEWAVSKEYASVNVWQKHGLKDDRPVGDLTANFTKDNLIKLWNSPLYVHEYYDEPYMYWIPLIMSVTGQRLGAVAQLYVSDIIIEEGIPTLHFTNMDLRQGVELNIPAPDKSIKTHRLKVPIHQGLLDKGFLVWVEKLREQGKKRLFEELPAPYIRYASDNLNDWLRVEGVHYARRKTIEVFRGTVKTALKYLKVEPWIRDAIIGHSENTSKMDERYTDPYTSEYLLEYVNKLPFPTKTVPRFRWVDGSFDTEAALISKSKKGKKKGVIAAYKFRRRVGDKREIYDTYEGKRTELVVPWAGMYDDIFEF